MARRILGAAPANVGLGSERVERGEVMGLGCELVRTNKVDNREFAPFSDLVSKNHPRFVIVNFV